MQSGGRLVALGRGRRLSQESFEKSAPQRRGREGRSEDAAELFAYVREIVLACWQGTAVVRARIHEVDPRIVRGAREGDVLGEEAIEFEERVTADRHRLEVEATHERRHAFERRFAFLWCGGVVVVKERLHRVSVPRARRPRRGALAALCFGIVSQVLGSGRGEGQRRSSAASSLRIVDSGSKA